MQSALADLLQRLDPQPSSRVQGLQRLSGGASQELWAFERVTGSDAVQRLILRRAPPGARLSGSGGPGLAAEAALIGKAGAAGVPVPDVIALLQPEHGLGEGFIMQKLDGDGWVFVQMGGTVVERELAPGEELHVDTGCLAAYTPSIDFDLITAGGVKSVLFGGEGLFFAQLTGPGKVWIQSLPFSRLAGRMLAAAGSRGGQNRGEGSVRGGLGDLIGGNN